MEARLWGGAVVPPGSVVRMKDATGWLGDRSFRIGYYSQADGLNCVWLVNEAGEYEQTTDQRQIRREVEGLQTSDEGDSYGRNRAVLAYLKDALEAL